MASPITAKTITITGPNNKAKSVPVINSLFVECLPFITDPFWIEIFQKAAQGKFHRGFAYSNGCLTFKKKTKTCRLECPAAPHEAASAIIMFYETTGNIMSVTDMNRHHEHMQNMLKQDQGSDYSEWKNIKRVAVRQQLINDFIEHLAAKYKLVNKQRTQCSQTVKQGFTRGCFTNSNINMKNGHIDSIRGLHYDTKSRLFSIDPACKPKKGSKSRGNKNVSIYRGRE